MSLGDCSGSNQKAFDASEAAYDDINASYEIVDKMGHDIYEAWRMAIYEKDEILDGGCAYLAKELNLSESELKDVVKSSAGEISDDDIDFFPPHGR